MLNFPRVSRSVCAQEPNDSYLRAKMRGLGILGMSFALIVRCSVRLSIGLLAHKIHNRISHIAMSVEYSRLRVTRARY